MIKINIIIAKRCTFPQSSILNPQSLTIFERNRETFTNSIQRRVKNAGLSLLEFIVVILIVLVLGIFGGQALINFIRLSVQQTSTGDVQGQSHFAFNQVMKELLIATSVSGCSNTSDITIQDIEGGNVTYALNGSGELLKTDSGSHVLANNITSMTFECLDENRIAMSDDIRARYLRVQMTAKSAESTESKYKSTVFLRDIPQ